MFPKERYLFPDEEIHKTWLAALTDPEVEVYLAVDAGQAVASVVVGHGYLRALYVMPSVWRRGVGGLLHDFALDRLRRASVEEARLWTLADNDGARSFYEKARLEAHWRDARRAVSAPPNRTRVRALNQRESQSLG